MQRSCRKYQEQGFLVGVDYIPVLPCLSDSGEQLTAMIKTAKNYGADFTLVGGLTLFREGKESLSQPLCDILKQYFAPEVQKKGAILDISICICSEGANNPCPE